MTIKVDPIIAEATVHESWHNVSKRDHREVRDENMCGEMELVRVDKDIDMNGQRYMRTDRRVPILYSRNMLVVQNDVAKLQSRRWY